MSQNNVKVSVILPSLNVLPYIRECVESVINQTLREIEIICVDAGSTDGTLEILQEYEKQDDRIKLIISDKKSYGYQMNLGMNAAVGEYIGIVETDDYVPANMYEELYAVARENNVDFVKADFYRFVGEKGDVSKALYSLNREHIYYNQIINIEEQQECFRFLMNTWSGIYSKRFLEENNIRHNETPGASYQDNGFWFQTFVYAKRAYFVDKPYYMNRRDNPNSSVYSKEKVFCICDEYDFILDILQKDKSLFQKFKFTYANICYREYKGNLGRIAERYYVDFLKRFAEDFKKLRDLGALDLRLFGEVDWNMLLSIMENPERFYEQTISTRNKIFEEIRKHKNIIIYGAGVIGRRTLNELTYNDDPADILCFAVSKKEENLSEYQGVPIREIRDLLDYREKGMVVIATTEIYHAEMKEMLDKLGFTNVIAIPESTEKDEAYYQKLHSEEYPVELEEWYKHVTGKSLHLGDPQTFNEKQQWLKLFDNTDIKAKLVDKIEVREWVKEKIGEKYLTPELGIYDNADDISFDKLPNQFIIKCSHGSQWNFFIEDKTDGERYQFDVIRRCLKAWLGRNYAFSSGLEIIYKDVKPRIIIEKPIGDIVENNYKILCFSGTPRFIVHDTQKTVLGANTRRDLYDLEWNHLPVTIKYPNADQTADRPFHLEELLRVAKILCGDFKFAVIHLFDTPEGVFFNEIKFSFGNGVEMIQPVEFDRELGSFIEVET